MNKAISLLKNVNKSDEGKNSNHLNTPGSLSKSSDTNKKSVFLESVQHGSMRMLGLVHKNLTDEMKSFRLKQNMNQLKALCPLDISNIPDSQLTDLTEFFLTTLNNKMFKQTKSQNIQCDLLQELIDEELHLQVDESEESEEDDIIFSSMRSTPEDMKKNHRTPVVQSRQSITQQNKQLKVSDKFSIGDKSPIKKNTSIALINKNKPIIEVEGISDSSS